MHTHVTNHAHHAQGHVHGQQVPEAFNFQSINLIFVVAVVANLSFTVLEAVYGVLANSASLLGDAGHNLSDVLGLLFAWGAAYLTTRKASDTYSYGYRRTTILAAISNAVILVFAAGFIAFESVEKLFNQTAIETVPVMVVAGIGIFVNAGTAMLFMRGGKTDLNLRGAYLHLAYDAVISVGVVISAGIIHVTGWLWIDSLAGLIIVGVILTGTWGLLKSSINLILDAVPEGIERASVREFLESIDGVTEVHDLHIWGMSTHENCLTAHLVMPENTLWDSASSYNSIGQQLERKFNIHHMTLQVEKGSDCTNSDCD